VRDIVGYLRARFAEAELRVADAHLTGCPRGADPAADCGCRLPERLAAELDARRELLDELVDWLESDLSSRRERDRTKRAMMLLAQPWADREDFDPYWRLET
jgi:hypothetical protein